MWKNTQQTIDSNYFWGVGLGADGKISTLCTFLYHLKHALLRY